MSVPAFRNSRSRVRRRRSHHALKALRVAIDKETGLPVLPHHKVKVEKKEVKAKKAETQKEVKNTSPVAKSDKPAKKLGAKAEGAKTTKVARKAKRESKTK